MSSIRPALLASPEILRPEASSQLQNKVLTPIQLWHEDEEFLEIYHSIKRNTVVDISRCFMLFQLLKHVKRVPGHLAEIGVYRGGTAKLLSSQRSPGKHLHLFDTFSGMPDCDEKLDRHRAGDFNETSVERVVAFLGSARDVQFHVGHFPATAASLGELRFSFVHVDCDIHQSVLDSCVFFYPRMESGGVMIFDDYGFVTCPGAKIAVDGFFASKPESPVYLPTGQCFVIKF